MPMLGLYGRQTAVKLAKVGVVMFNTTCGVRDGAVVEVVDTSDENEKVVND